MLNFFLKYLNWSILQAKLSLRERVKASPALIVAIIAIKVLIKVVVVVMLTSCNTEYSYSKYLDTPHNSWKNSDTLTFEIPAQKTERDIFLSVRYTDKYKYSNIWLKYFSEQFTDRKSIILFDNKGIPKGKTLGANSTIIVPFSKSKITKKTTTLKLVQNMRENDIKGITAVGILIK